MTDNKKMLDNAILLLTECIKTQLAISNTLQYTITTLETAKDLLIKLEKETDTESNSKLPHKEVWLGKK